MMEVLEVLSVRKYKAGYEVREEIVDDREYGGDGIKMKRAYTPEGYYIGDSKTAYHLCKIRGIRPELISSGSNVCFIGFCEKETKWYGWTHRGICGFTIGSTCEKDDCHYTPDNFDEIKSNCLHLVGGLECAVNEPLKGVHVHVDEPFEVCELQERNYFLRACSEEICVYEVGRGEWEAKTLEDAKQMAVDFVRGVS